MTLRNAGVFTAGVVAAFALGVVASPTIRADWSALKINSSAATAASHAAPAHERVASTSGESARSSHSRPVSSPRHEAVANKDASTIEGRVPVSLWEPDLRDRVKAVLNPGAHLDIAADDFDSAEQFVTVAHAAHDTKIPFMVLKDRVLNHGQSLAEAIHESRPELNAKAEAARARAAARSDLNLAG